MTTPPINLPDVDLGMSHIKNAFTLPNVEVRFSQFYAIRPGIPANGEMPLSALRGYSSVIDTPIIGSILLGATTDATSFISVRMFKDGNNNLHVYGAYVSSASVVIKNIDGTNSLVSLPINTIESPFVISYNAAGTCLRGCNLLNTANNGVGFATGLTVDNVGNIYITGFYNNGNNGNRIPINNLDGTPSALQLNAANTEEIYLLKYNTSGVLQQGQTILSGSEMDNATYIATDSVRNVYMIGFYNHTGTGGNASVSLRNLSTGNASAFSLPGTASVRRAFICKYSSAGVCTAATQLFSNINSDYVSGLYIDSSDNIYVTGQGTGGPNILINNLGGTSSGLAIQPTQVTASNDALLVKYSSNGNVLFGVNIVSSASSNDIATNLCFDNSNNMYIVGNYQSTTPLFVRNLNGSNSTVQLPATLNQDIMLLKYASNVCVAGTGIVSGTNNDSSYSIANDSEGNIYVTGTYIATSSSNPTPVIRHLSGSNSTLTVQNKTYPSGIVLKYDTSGNCTNACAPCTGANSSNYVDMCTAIGSNVFITGRYMSTTSFNIKNFNNRNSSNVYPPSGTFNCPFLIKLNAY